MQLVDTHCHLDFQDYTGDLKEVIERSRNAGVVRMIVPGTDIESTAKAQKLAMKYPEIYFSAGIHPHAAERAGTSGLDALRDIATGGEKVVAIGEIGIDYYRKFSDPDIQKKIFEGCIRLARELDLPVILHNRNADDDFLDILRKNASSRIKGVCHCFSGGVNLLKEILAMGLFVSFTGNITFDSAQDLRKKITNVPLEKLLLETDSPYITPVPHRGKRNEPAYVKLLIDVYSDIYGLSARDIARVTTYNANRLFGLGLKEESKVLYPIRDSLYINITNRCTNECTFCTRQYSDNVMGHKLKLEGEPVTEEVIAQLEEKLKTGYREVVFCGYGEPTLRLGSVKKIAAFLKQKGSRTRLTTNGTGNLIAGRNIAHELRGLIDKVSVSLNAPDPEGFNRLCRPVMGERTFEGVLGFIDDCVKENMDVEVTCVDLIGENAVNACRKISDEKNVRFRLRKIDVVG